MSTTTPSQRNLGRGVSTLIPQNATDRAMAALSGLETVPVHVGLLQTATLLLEESARSATIGEGRPDQHSRDAAHRHVLPCSHPSRRAPSG
ncbi:hypothetical protein ACF08N_35940 [Streptomyces sp. NPDC015127]|uniref:hypothetical protein n=1 Tax=Streptomyces sp. NPDC015127 TaxID=3364939 RepID=UPI00370268A6